MDMRAEFVQRIDGLFVGSLSESELADFNDCVASGHAARSYEGAGGLMGLAKVRACYEQVGAK